MWLRKAWNPSEGSSARSPRIGRVETLEGCPSSSTVQEVWLNGSSFKSDWWFENIFDVPSFSDDYIMIINLTAVMAVIFCVILSNGLKPPTSKWFWRSIPIHMGWGWRRLKASPQGHYVCQRAGAERHFWWPVRSGRGSTQWTAGHTGCIWSSWVVRVPHWWETWTSST